MNKAAFALLVLLALPSIAVENASTLIVVYQAAPENRAAFLRELTGPGARELQRWKDEGALQDYRLLIFGAMLMLVMRFSPGGLAGLVRTRRPA